MKITTIYIDEQILEYCKANKVNLSEWVNNRFKQEYMSLQSKINELNSLTDKVDELRQQIKQLQEKQQFVKQQHTQREIRFILNIPQKLQNGFKIDAICRLFNAEFNRNYTKQELQSFIILYKKP